MFDQSSNQTELNGAEHPASGEPSVIALNVALHLVPERMPDQHHRSVSILKNMVQEGGKDSNLVAFSILAFQSCRTRLQGGRSLSFTNNVQRKIQKQKPRLKRGRNHYVWTQFTGNSDSGAGAEFIFASIF